jgi:hypothetical protein
MSLPQYLLCLLPLVTACASLPESLTKRQDPIEVVKEAFSWRLNSIGQRVSDREVVNISPEQIVYKEQGRECRLSFEDIAIIDTEIRSNRSEDFVNVRLFLVKDSASINSTVVVNGTFSFGRSHIALYRRPKGTLARLKGSLDKLRINRGEDLKAPQSQPAKKKQSAAPKNTKPPAPKNTDSAELLESKLIRLKEWFEKGLITEDDYQRKRQSLLDKY